MSTTKKAVKKTPAKAKASPKTPAATVSPAKAAKAEPAQPPRRPAAAAPARTPTPGVRLGEKDLKELREELLAMRDRLNGKIVKMREQSLKRDDEVNPEEDGTDAFDRLFVLERAGNDQDIIYRIDEALRAIDEGTYGVCEACGGLIQRPRLSALPFAKNCIRCQSEMERGRGGHALPRRMIG